MIKKHLRHIVILATTFTTPISLYSLNLSNGSVSFELGGYNTVYDKSQSIEMAGLVGDRYKAKDDSDQNVVAGVSYMLGGPQFKKFSTSYGVSGYYLARTKASGTIFQEHVFPNLAYGYKVSHLPIYATAKIQTINLHRNYDLDFNLGLGPNFISAYKYHETSLDGITFISNSFASHTATDLSFNVGIGLKSNNLFNNQPIQCGYKFFYLGEGSLKKNNSQILNKLKTGNTSANAIICSIAVV